MGLALGSRVSSRDSLKFYTMKEKIVFFYLHKDFYK